MQPTDDDVLAVLSAAPLAIGAVGVALLDRAGLDAGDPGAPVGQRLAASGLSLSALQRTVDGLVTAGLATELKGRELWDRGLPTAGTKAMGRYYLAAGHADPHGNPEP